MAFDQSTRNRLQRFVTDARRTLEEEFTRQLQNDYGLDPISGTASWTCHDSVPGNGVTLLFGLGSAAVTGRRLS
ncbi:hypothetical protein, partial [Alterinioella nitratireducens]|uniref:hypothetical protein n=1 Tax=Alterinioella nitratireducens TaxID=2735915 RepID=UPI001551800A